MSIISIIQTDIQSDTLLSSTNFTFPTTQQLTVSTFQNYSTFSTTNFSTFVSSTTDSFLLTSSALNVILSSSIILNSTQEFSLKTSIIISQIQTSLPTSNTTMILPSTVEATLSSKGSTIFSQSSISTQQISTPFEISTSYQIVPTSLSYLTEFTPTTSSSDGITTTNFILQSEILSITNTSSFVESVVTSSEIMMSPSYQTSMLYVPSISTKKSLTLSTLPETLSTLTRTAVLTSALSMLSISTTVPSLTTTTFSTSTTSTIVSQQCSFSSTPSAPTPTTTTTTSISSSQIPTNSPTPRNSPVVMNIIETQFFGSGKITSYQIPQNIFMDVEDGDTRNLTLVCFTGDEKNNISMPWIVFNSTTQTLTAFPLSYDYDNQVKPQLLHLRAYDHSGLYTTTQFQIAIHAPLKNLSYLVSMKLLISFDEFISSPILRFELASRIGEFYRGPLNNNSVYFHSVRNGSTILSFNNLTLATTNLCDKESIQSNVDVIKSPSTNEPQKGFKDFLSPQFPIVDMDVKYAGVCAIAPTNAPSTGGGEDSKYLMYVIPIIVLSIILIIVIIIVCIVYRKQRNKRTFYVGSRRYEKGQPVLFPDELELQAPPKKRLNEDLTQGAYLGPYDDNTSFDSPDFGGRAGASNKPPVSQLSSDDDSSTYSYFKTPSGSPPEYNEPPPYSFPLSMESSEI